MFVGEKITCNKLLKDIVGVAIFPNLHKLFHLTLETLESSQLCAG